MSEPQYKTFKSLVADFADSNPPYSFFHIMIGGYIPLEIEEIRKRVFNALEVKPKYLEVINHNPPPNDKNNDNDEIFPHCAILLYYDPPIYEYVPEKCDILLRFGFPTYPMAMKPQGFNHVLEYERWIHTSIVKYENDPVIFWFMIKRLQLDTLYEKSLTRHVDMEDGCYHAQTFICFYQQIIDKEYIKMTLAYGQVVKTISVSHFMGWTLVFLKYGSKVNWKHKYGKFILSHVSNVIHTLRVAHHATIFHKAIHNCDPTNEKGNFGLTPGEIVQFCKTESEVAFISQPKELMSNLKAFEIKKASEELDGAQYLKNYKLWSWQLALYNTYLSKLPDDRTIIWVHSEKPRMGKTVMASALMAQQPQFFYSVANPSNEYHMKTIKCNALKSGWNNHCIFINLSMRFNDYENLYSMLECLKDPLNSSMKYQGATQITGYGHVVVLSNFAPNPYKWNETLRKWEPLIDPNRLLVIKCFEDGKDPNPEPPKGLLEGLKEFSIQMGQTEISAQAQLDANTQRGVAPPAHPKTPPRKQEEKTANTIANAMSGIPPEVLANNNAIPIPVNIQTSTAYHAVTKEDKQSLEKALEEYHRGNKNISEVTRTKGIIK